MEDYIQFFQTTRDGEPVGVVRSIHLTHQELRDAIGAENLVVPKMDDAVRRRLGRPGKLIGVVGLPKRIGDWFKACERLDILSETEGYRSRHQVAVPDDCVVIGTSETGVHIVNCSTGHVIYLDSCGHKQLINTSIHQFLEFDAHFLRALAEGRTAIDALRSRLEEIDGRVLGDPNGVWSFMVEEAEAGMF